MNRQTLNIAKDLEKNIVLIQKMEDVINDSIETMAPLLLSSIDEEILREADCDMQGIKLVLVNALEKTREELEDKLESL